MKHRLPLVLAVAALAVAVPASTASAKTTITMSGSTSVAPLAAKLAKGYLKAHPGAAKFKLAQGGSDVGVADVAAGRVTIGNSSRDPKPTDPGGLVFNKIARDAICIVTNPANPVAEPVAGAGPGDLLRRRSATGARFPARRTTGPIDLVVRTAASGTQDAFQKIFMGSAKVSTSAAQKASNGLVPAGGQDATRTRSATCRWPSRRASTTPRYKGVACNLRNAKSGQYGGVRNFWMVTRGTRRRARAQKFIRWVQRSKRRAADRRARTGSRSEARWPRPAHDGPSRTGADRRAERLLGALASRGAGADRAAWSSSSFAKAWPSFSHNGLAWFGAGGNVDQQLERRSSTRRANPARLRLHARTRGRCSTRTALDDGVAVVARPRLRAARGDLHRRVRARRRLRRVLEPVVRLLAAVPSVIYGLIGILVLVPFVGNHLISAGPQGSRSPTSSSSPARACSSAVVILTVMITPIMIAIIVDALRAVPAQRGRRAPPRSASTAGARCGRSRVRAARPAIIAAPCSPRARALGEAIMLSMVSGSVGFAPNPLDGLTFFFEPLRPLAATIVDNAEGLSVDAVRPDALRVRARCCSCSSLFLSLGGWAAKQPLKRYGVRRLMARRRTAAGRRAPARGAARESLARVALERPHRRSALCWAAGHRAVR